MESLVGRCVDALARAALECGRSDTAEDEEATIVTALVERLELLYEKEPPFIGQRFTQRLQHHTLHTHRHESQGPDTPSASERALWSALIDHQWFLQLTVAALPLWLQAAPKESQWSALTTLQTLDVSRHASPHLTVFFLETLALQNLQNLNLSGGETVVTDAQLEMLATQCHCLQHLDVSNCTSISDTGLSLLLSANSETLYSVRLSGLRQVVGADALLHVLERCVHLQTLGLGDCVGLVRLPHLPASVTALDFHGLTQFTDDAIRVALLGCFHQLQRLRLGESELSGNSLMQHVQATPPTALPLLALDLSWCQHLTSDAIERLVRRAPALTSLTLRCTKLQDPVVVAIGETLSHLQLLNLERCDGLTSEGLEQLASPRGRGLRRLEKLNLSWTNVTVAVLTSLLVDCASTIRKVRLQGCKGVDHTLVEMLEVRSEQWSRLEVVDFAWTNGVTDEQLEGLAHKIPTTRWIGYYGTDITYN